MFLDGVDLRNFKRWSRAPSVEVRTALELGEPPAFDGVLCVDCGNRFRTEFDHVQPRVARGPSSHGNLKARCWSCHQAKTERDRRAGKLKPGRALTDFDRLTLYPCKSPADTRTRNRAAGFRFLLGPEKRSVTAPR